jgi:hypothetical protein
LPQPFVGFALCQSNIFYPVRLGSIHCGHIAARPGPMP